MSEMSQIASESAIEWQAFSEKPIARITEAKQAIENASITRYNAQDATSFLGWAQEQLLSGVRDRMLARLKAEQSGIIAENAAPLQERAGQIGINLLQSIQSSFDAPEKIRYTALNASVDAAHAKYHDSAKPLGMFESMDTRLDGMIENGKRARYGYAALGTPGLHNPAQDLQVGGSRMMAQARGLKDAMHRLRDGLASSSAVPSAVRDELNQILKDEELAGLIYGNHPIVGRDPLAEIGKHSEYLFHKVIELKERIAPLKDRVAEINAEDDAALHEALEARTNFEAEKLEGAVGPDVSAKLDSFWEWNKRAHAQRLKAEPALQNNRKPDRTI